MNSDTVGIKTWKMLPAAILRAIICFGMLVLGGFHSTAGTVTMTTGDGFNQTSFNTGLHWDSGVAPTAGNDYVTAAFILRSPAAAPNAITFLGDSLTVSPGGALYQKLNPLVMTVNNLTNSGRVVNAQAGAFTVLGNMYVPILTNATGGTMDTGSGNSSPADSRTITNGMTVSGPGNLTNTTTDANWPNNSAAQGTVVYTGNNTAFTGAQIATRNTVIVVGSLANLGGNPSSNSPAQLTLDNGILRPTNSFSLNNPNSGITIGTNGGKFDIATGLILTNANALAGAGTLSLTNAGSLVHSGTAANFTGTLSVANGSLVLAAGGSLAGSNTLNVGSAGTFDVTAAGITLANGQTLAGGGSVLGTVTAGTGSKVSPGTAGVPANLTIGALTLSGAATLPYHFTGTTNDLIVVSGNLSPSGVTSVQLVSVPPTNGIYTLITVAGTLGGTAANFNVAALNTRTKHFSVSYDQLSTPKRVLLTVSGTGSPGNLVWQGDVVNGTNNVWDIDTTSNWLNGASTDVYFDADTVNFTDGGATNQPILNVTVNPGAVNFNSSSNYTLTGTGGIAGAVVVSKSGTGTATLSVADTYSSGTIINNGVLRPGVATALGNPPGATALASVSGTGTLDINGAALDATYTNIVQINGNGFSGTQGAIDNSIGGLTSGSGDIGIATLALAGNSTVSATANWQIGRTGSGIAGNGFTLTKIGANYLYLRHAAATPLNGLVIAGGGVLFWDHADAAGATATITLANGGYIDTWNPGNNFNGLTFNNPIVVNDPVIGGAIANSRPVTFNHPPYDIYNGGISLLSGSILTITNTSFLTGTPSTYGRVTINGGISGTGGLTVIGGTTHFLGSGAPEFFGGNLVTCTGNNSYSGPTLVTNLVQLLISTANQSGGTYDIVDYGTLDVAVASGHPTIPMSTLILEQQILGPGNLGFTRLASMPSVPVVYATNLVINTGGVILPPLAGYSIGQFPLIKYNGTIGGAGFGGLALGALPAGVTATLVNNTANHTIDLQVTAAGIQWTGANSTNWDIGTTVNWFNPVSSLAETYADGETVVFGDTATTFNVNTAQALQPGGITVNATNNYSFSSSGTSGISGSASLIKNGSGTLTVSCTNNTFTGGTFITGGTLKLADLNYVFPYGGGALNNNLGTVTVGNGGTLDINGVQVPNFQSFGPEGYNVFISGSGVGGNGALVNNNTNDNDLADPGYVTLTGDATVGGTGDVNIRHGVSPQLHTQSGAYTLTKVGPGQFRIRYLTTVDTNFGPINILQGIVSYESSSTLGLGDPTKSIIIGNGGGFAWGTTSANCVRPLVCSNNATLYGYNTVSNIFNSPVSLVSGNVNLNANFYNGMIFSNVISGAGGVTLLGQTRVTFAASNTYGGNTVVMNCNGTNGNNNGSILRLVGNGSINSSLNITLQGIVTNQAFPGALDASGRVDGTLTLVSAQTLRGDNGSYVLGKVVANSGSTITPGGAGNIQSMTFSNNLTLSSSSVVAMDVSLDGGTTNDLIRVVGTNNYAGILQIANIGVTPLANGSAFKLFNNGSFSGNFASISGSPGSGLAWSFNPTNGIATVVAGTATNPTNIAFSVSGSQMTLTWPSDHLGWTLQTQTNTLGVGISTNWVDVSGSSSSTTNVVTIHPNAPAVFYRLRL